MTSRLPFSLMVLAALTSGCAEQPSPPLPGTLSQSERALLSSLPPNETVGVLKITSQGTIETHRVEVEAFDEFQKNTLHEDPLSLLALDLPVSSWRDERGNPNEQLLYSGKEEFGLDEWIQAHPQADGRNVILGIVDDGVALGRPGLTETSIEKPKIVRSVAPASVWMIGIHPERPSCIPEPKAAAAFRQWDWSESGLAPLDSATLLLPFDLTECGSPQSGAPLSPSCANWSTLLHPKLVRAGEDPRLQGVYIENGSHLRRIAMDLDGDSRIVATEIFAPLSEDPGSFHRFATGEALGFDVHDLSLVGPSPSACAQPQDGGRFLNVIPPELPGNSHGEGVASVATGHRIAGRAFDGVAPGAQIVDVGFATPVSTEEYTISELARVLQIAGRQSDLVNLSFGLFFSSPTAQVAMSRVLEAALKGTRALYFFSAGNNGPGRGSMNRSLIYPSMGIPVAAWLNARMSQTVFGSSTPHGGVVSYSSRGPAPDGYAGALLLSPLAAMAVGPAGDGVRAFSGTSSATPALAGLAARVLSQIRAEGLPWSRDLLKKSLMAAAKPVEHTPFIDQGFGIPRLVDVLQAYRRLSSSRKALPELRVTGEFTVHGIPQKGISVRGERNRSNRYGFRISPVFSPETEPQLVADYTENLAFESNVSWVRLAPFRLIGRSSLRIELIPDWEALGDTPGEHLAEVRVRNADSGELRTVIPVTVIIPLPTAPQLDQTLELEANEIRRVFLKAPDWAKYLAVSAESSDPSSPLCGLGSLFDPAGVNRPATSNAGTPFRREQVFSIQHHGVHEWVYQGNRGHSSCPFRQSLQVQIRWLSIDASLLEVESASKENQETELRLKLMAHSHSPLLRGTLQLYRPGVERTITLTPGSRPFTWSSTETFHLTEGLHRFRLAPEFEAAQAGLLGYPSFGLRVPAPRAGIAPYWFRRSEGWWTLPKKYATEELGASTLQLRSFDLGLPASSQPLSPALVHRRETPSAERTESSLATVELRRHNPGVVELSLQEKDAPLGGHTLLCRFTPSGWSVAVPCSSVTLPDSPPDGASSLNERSRLLEEPDAP